MQTVDIGAARIRLVVDASEYDSAIAQGLNHARAFGTEAEAAFNRASDGSRRAATRLLDYVANLGKADSQMARLVTQASSMGVADSVIRAATARWAEYQAKVAQAEAAQEQFNATLMEAQQINAAFNQQRAQNAQQSFDQDFGVEPIRRSLEYLEEQQRVVRALTLQAELREESERNIANEIARAADEAKAVNQAFDQQIAQNAQRKFNEEYGVSSGERSGAFLAEQQRVVAVLSEQAAAMDALELQTKQTDAATDAFVQSIDAEREALGKNHYEILRMQIARKGLGKAAYDAVDALEASHRTMRTGTLTAKQYEWAMRGLPAQMTDIFVGLASGQQPLMVLLQQGGQLKDMFGGIGAAAKAVGGAMATTLLNPLVAIPAALAAIAFAAYRAESRMEAFSLAGIRSGGLAGTGQQLEEIAAQLNDLENINTGNADAAVQRIASGGLLVGRSFDLAAEATSRWATVTGVKVDEVAAKFESIARDPLQALDKLNEAENFLTYQQRERIRVLQEEGKWQEAATEGVEIYADVLNNRSKDVADNLGNIKSLWIDIKDVTGSAATAIGTFADDVVGYLMRVNKAQMTMYNTMLRAGTDPSLTLGQRWSLGTSLASNTWGALTGAADFSNVQGGAPNQATVTREATKALEELDKQLSASGTKAQQYDKAVVKLKASLSSLTNEMLSDRGIVRAADGSYSGSGYESLLKSLQDKYKDRNAGKLPSGRDATQAIRDQLQIELALLQTQTKHVEAQYEQRQLTAQEYYSQLMTFAERERDLVVQANNDQIKALDGKKDAERQIHTLQASNARAQEQFAQRSIELKNDETKAIRQQQQAYADFIQTLQSANENVQRQMDTMVDRVTMGEREFEIQSRINQAYQEQTERLREIQKFQDEYPESVERATEAEQRRQAVYAATGEAIDKIVDGYGRMEKAQGEWSNGVDKAWKDWLTEVSDVAGQTGQIFTNILDGFSNSVADALAGNLKSFESFWDTIHIQILQFIAKQQLTKWMTEIFGGGTNSEGATMGTIFDLLKVSGWGFAKGGVPGGEGLAAYRNKIVSTPTIFPFARGGVPNVGLMGEVSGRSEGIFPLARTSGGELGVRVVETSSRRTTNNIQQTFVVQGTPDGTTRNQMAKKAATETTRAMSRG